MSGAAALLDRLRERFGDAAVEAVEFRGETTVFVPAELILEALGALREAVEGELLLTDLTAVDRHPAEPRFEVVYLLTALGAPVRIRMKVRLPGELPSVASVTPLWSGANWLEREVFDMFGVRFVGHPDPGRILLPDDWEGHPLRKDYPLTEEPVEFVGHTPKVPSEIIPTVTPRPMRGGDASG